MISTTAIHEWQKKLQETPDPVRAEIPEYGRVGQFTPPVTRTCWDSRMEQAKRREFKNPEQKVRDALIGALMNIEDTMPEKVLSVESDKDALLVSVEMMHQLSNMRPDREPPDPKPRSTKPSRGNSFRGA